MEILGLKKANEKKEKSFLIVLLIIFSIGVIGILAYACYMLALDEYKKENHVRSYKAGMPALWVYIFLTFLFIALQIYILVAIVECNEKFIHCFPLYYVLAFIGVIFISWLLFSKKLTWNHIVGIIFIIVGVIIYLIW
jgi:drug/metabolite transporter (DMT)-like permease